MGGKGAEMEMRWRCNHLRDVPYTRLPGVLTTCHDPLYHQSDHRESLEVFPGMKRKAGCTIDVLCLCTVIVISVIIIIS